jgi:hypothetical protein
VGVVVVHTVWLELLVDRGEVELDSVMLVDQEQQVKGTQVEQDRGITLLMGQAVGVEEVVRLGIMLVQVAGRVDLDYQVQ